MYYARRGPPPKRHRIGLTLSKDTYPDLLKWLWEHPYAGQEVIRQVLERARRDGTLDAIVKEIEDGAATGQG